MHDMEHMYVEGKVFDKLDFKRDPITKGEYENCRFTTCDFAEANLADFKFLNCEFINCNLSLAKLHKILTLAVISGCRLALIHAY